MPQSCCLNAAAIRIAVGRCQGCFTLIRTGGNRCRCYPDISGKLTDSTTQIESVYWLRLHGMRKQQLVPSIVITPKFKPPSCNSELLSLETKPACAGFQCASHGTGITVRNISFSQPGFFACCWSLASLVRNSAMCVRLSSTGNVQ